MEEADQEGNAFVETGVVKAAAEEAPTKVAKTEASAPPAANDDSGAETTDAAEGACSNYY